MARLFVTASAQSLSRSGAVLTAIPITFAAWARINDLTTDSGIMACGDTGGTSYFGIRVVQTTGIPQAVARSASVNANAAAGAAITLNQWHHVCGVYTNNSSRACFLDGANKGTNATAVTPASLDTTAIGATYFSGVLQVPADGDVAEVAMWNAALTDAEVALLASGVSPMTVRPASLIAYWPITGRVSPEISFVGEFPMTLNGAPVQSQHPPKVGWFPYRVGGSKKIAVAAGSIVPKVHYSNMMRVA